MATIPSSRLASSRNWINTAAASHATRSQPAAWGVAAKAMPAPIPHTMPAIEMPLGERPRRASHRAIRCQIGQPRAAIGRRSVGW